MFGHSVTLFEPTLEAFLVSTGIVALAEMGDKTQLLALILAARFRKPWPIVLGIFVATIANHAMAGAVGAWVTTMLGPDALRWVLGGSFIAMAVWMLIPTVWMTMRPAARPVWVCLEQRWWRFSWQKWETRRRSRLSCWPRSTRPGLGWWRERHWA